MSDDTPTERFRPDGTPIPPDGGRDGADRAGEDAPTQAFDPFASDDQDLPGEGDRIQRDDTPTELFRADRPAADDDAPTRRFAQQPGDRDPVVASHVPVYDGRDDSRFAPTQAYATLAAAAPVPPRAPNPPASRPPGNKSRGPVIALIVIGTLILVGLIVLALVLGTRDQGPAADASPSPSATTESPSPTPSETPTPTPTETEEPAPAPASFVSFSPADGTSITCPDEDTEVPLVFSWSSADAERAWIGQGTTDARERPTSEVDTSGTYRDLVFDCGGESQVYTVSLENAEGELTSESVTLVRDLQED